MRECPHDQRRAGAVWCQMGDGEGDWAADTYTEVAALAWSWDLEGVLNTDLKGDGGLQRMHLPN